MYLTPDDGVTWQLLNLPHPRDLPANTSFFNLEVQSFDGREGVLSYYSCSTHACYSADLNLVYRTSDGGTTWSEPVRLPTDVASTIFIDGTHWFAMTFAFAPTPNLTDTRVRSLMRTDDGGLHWKVLLAAPDGGYLPGWDWFGTTGFVDPMHGWTTSQGDGNHGVALLRTTDDGGRTWSDRALPN